MKKTIILVMGLLVVAGCAVKKPYYATGGSRADGTVDMAYDIALMEQAVVDDNQAQQIANQKCKVWGYSESEPFGGKVENCYSRNGYGDCLRGQMVVKYQCLGNLDANKPNQFITPLAPAPMSKDQYKQMQVEELTKKNLPYAEYTKQYNSIMAQ